MKDKKPQEACYFRSTDALWPLEANCCSKFADLRDTPRTVLRKHIRCRLRFAHRIQAQHSVTESCWLQRIAASQDSSTGSSMSICSMSKVSASASGARLPIDTKAHQAALSMSAAVRLHASTQHMQRAHAACAPVGQFVNNEQQALHISAAHAVPQCAKHTAWICPWHVSQVVSPAHRCLKRP